MIPNRISLVTIGANDLPQLRMFYKRFGWVESDGSSDTYAVFKTRGVSLSIFPIRELVKDTGLAITDTPQCFKGVTFAINVDKKDDVDSVINDVKLAGGKIVRKPSEAFWGGRTASFLDPENNSWEVAWNPVSVFDEHGTMVSI
jgi:uncharacterized protein